MKSESDFGYSKRWKDDSKKLECDIRLLHIRYKMIDEMHRGKKMTNPVSGLKISYHQSLQIWLSFYTLSQGSCR